MAESNNSMPRATFDILDAAIPEEYSEWLSRSDELRFMPYRRTFRVLPASAILLANSIYSEFKALRPICCGQLSTKYSFK